MDVVSTYCGCWMNEQSGCIFGGFRYSPWPLVVCENKDLLCFYFILFYFIFPGDQNFSKNGVYQAFHFLK